MVLNFDDNRKKKGINHQGNLNPMFGKRHTQETKQKISDSQKSRYEQYKNAMNNHHATMDELLQSEIFNRKVEKVIMESINKLLKNNGYGTKTDKGVGVK